MFPTRGLADKTISYNWVPGSGFFGRSSGSSEQPKRPNGPGHRRIRPQLTAASREAAAGCMDPCVHGLVGWPGQPMANGIFRWRTGGDAMVGGHRCCGLRVPAGIPRAMSGMTSPGAARHPMISFRQDVPGPQRRTVACLRSTEHDGRPSRLPEAGAFWTDPGSPGMPLAGRSLVSGGSASSKTMMTEILYDSHE